MSPDCALQSLVQSENTLLRDDLPHTVDETVVLVRLCLVLHADLDELEGHDDEGLGGTGGGACEDREGLVHLGDAEDVAPDLAPFIVGCEFGCSVRKLDAASKGRCETCVKLVRTAWELPS